VCAARRAPQKLFCLSPRLLILSVRLPIRQTPHFRRAPRLVYLERPGIDALKSSAHHASTLTTMAFLSDASASKETRVLTFGAAFSLRRERIKGHIFLMIPLAWAPVQYMDSSSRLSSIWYFQLTICPLH
jgi:hypothetical protein